MPLYETLETTLAQGTGSTVSLVQVLIYALFGVIFVSTMVKNIIKENKKKARNKQASGDAQQGGGASLEEIAARRRAQLQELARQRGGGKAGSQTQAARPQALVGDDTANLSMADRIARARAANQRQASAGHANPLPRKVPPARPSVAPQATGASAREQRAAAMRQRAMQREQQRREALAARQRQIQQARAQQRAAPQPQPTPAARRPLPPVQTPHPVSVAPHDEVHRMVADTPPQVTKSSRRHASASMEVERALQVDRGGAGAAKTLLNFGKLSHADLRRAFILKEVLDRPLAERDALAHVNEG